MNQEATPDIDRSYRYFSSKLHYLAGAAQGLTELTQGLFPYPRFLEIHLGDPCQLRCIYCRGELRPVPNEEVFLPLWLIARTMNELSPFREDLFVRFSGSIGEPLLHPDFGEISRTINDAGIKWGLTTNGLLLDHCFLDVARSQYVHVSLDAGSEKTYIQLKGGKPGDYSRVLNNIRMLVERRGGKQSPQVIVSVLLQADNISELPKIKAAVTEARADQLEVKMQMPDARRRMTRDEIEAAYRSLEQLFSFEDHSGTRLVIVQDLERSLAMSEGLGGVPFQRCYANMLGLSSTIDPRGNVQPCCNYFSRTIPPQGNLYRQSLLEIWDSETRRQSLKKAPLDFCDCCSPSDFLVNRMASSIIGEVGIGEIMDV